MKPATLTYPMGSMGEESEVFCPSGSEHIEGAFGVHSGQAGENAPRVEGSARVVSEELWCAIRAVLEARTTIGDADDEDNDYDVLDVLDRMKAEELVVSAAEMKEMA